MGCCSLWGSFKWAASKILPRSRNAPKPEPWNTGQAGTVSFAEALSSGAALWKNSKLNCRSTRQEVAMRLIWKTPTRSHVLLSPIYVTRHCYETGVCQVQNVIPETILYRSHIDLMRKGLKAKGLGASSTVNQTAIRGLVTNSIHYPSGDPSI